MKTDCLDESTSGSDSHEARAFHNCIVSHVYTRSVQYSPMINDAPIGVHHDIDGVIKFIDRHPYPSLSGQEYICHSTIGSNLLPPAKQMRRRLKKTKYAWLLYMLAYDSEEPELAGITNVGTYQLQPASSDTAFEENLPIVTISSRKSICAYWRPVLS